MTGKHFKNKKDNKLTNKIPKQTLNKQKRKINIFSSFILLTFIFLFIFSSIKIFNWFQDTHKIKNEMNDINEVVNITEKSDKNI